MTNAVAVRNEAPMVATPDNVAQALQRVDRQQAFRALLGDTVPLERFEQIVVQAVVRNPDLHRASLASLLDAVRVSATLKLEPTGILGEGYLIRYGNDAQFEAGYRGLMKLARRSGQISAIDAQIVYANDAFDIQLGSEPRIDHRPLLEGERGGFRGAYAYARLTTGEMIVEWMPDADIQHVRKSSRNGSGTSSPWVNHFGEMARKTVLKRLMKRLPLGADAEMALRVEAEADQAPTPHRAPSAAVVNIRERLGVPNPQVDDREPDEIGEVPLPIDETAQPESPPPAPAAAAQPRCEVFSDKLGACVREPHTEGMHRNRDKETWR